MLKFKRIISSAILVLILNIYDQDASAQLTVGADIGVNNNYLKNNLSNKTFTQNKYKSGYSGSFIIQYHFNKWLATESGIGVISKNHRIERTDFFSGIKIKTSNLYLTIPLLLRLSIPTEGKINGFLNLGISNSFWTYSYINASLPNILAPKDYFPEQSYDNLYQLVSQQTIKQKHDFEATDNRYEIAGILGAGVSFRASKSYELFTRLNYSIALNDQQKKYQIDQLKKQNLTYGLSFGILYNLKAKAK